MGDPFPLWLLHPLLWLWRIVLTIIWGLYKQPNYTTKISLPKYPRVLYPLRWQLLRMYSIFLRVFSQINDYFIKNWPKKMQSDVLSYYYEWWAVSQSLLLPRVEHSYLSSDQVQFTPKGSWERLSQKKFKL